MEQAVTIYRTLVETNPQAYLLILAHLLNNVGVIYKDNYLHRLALAAYKELRNIYRTFAKTNPLNHLHVADPLINLAIYYAETKPNRNLSLAHAKEALSLLTPFLEQGIPYAQQAATKLNVVFTFWEEQGETTT